MQRSRRRYWVIFAALFVLAYGCLQLVAHNTLVRIEISHSQSDLFKIYWTTANDASWTESKSASVYVNSRKRNHILRLPIGLADIENLRIDPGEEKGVKTEITEISLYNLAVGKVRFSGQQAFSRFEPIKHVSKLKAGPKLSFVSNGNDPGFIVDFPRARLPFYSLLLVVHAGLLAVVLLSLCSRLPWLARELNWVPAGMLLVSSLAIAMAIISRYDFHPDEYVHLAAAKFYANQVVPPEVCSEGSQHTYSVYGVSRLDNREIAYYIGGRYLQLVEFIPAPDYLKMRFLNIAMLLVLVLLAFNHVRARYLFLPILLTPQIWYLFSYYNSDALSLFVVFLTAYQVFIPESMLRRLLNGQRPPGFVLWVLGLAFLIAMQFWLKLNYMFYPILLGLLAASWWLSNRRLPDKAFIRPLWVAMALGTTLFLSWEISRHAINDFELAERVLDCREQLSQEQYKPSIPLDQTHYNVRWRDKGISLSYMLLGKDWPERIFYTGLGAYGYTEFLSQTGHYAVVSAFILMLLAYVLLTVTFRGGTMGRLSVLSTLASIFGVTAAAAYINWTVDFQPQGRYLMVYFPLMGTLIAMYWQKLSVLWLSLLASVPFLMGLYSFLAVALVEIPK